MYKKVALVAAGILFSIACSPLFASAQSVTLPTVPANASISQLEALIVQLTQLLDTLLAQRSSGQSSGQASATIGQSTEYIGSVAQPVSAPTITGTESNATNLWVVLVSSSYVGPSDWSTITSLGKTGSGFNGYVTIPVSAVLDGSGHWSAQFDNVPAGTYSIYVFTYNGTGYTGLTDGVTNINTYQQPSSSVSLVATVPVPISYSIVAGGATGVTVGAFALQSSGENVNLQQIGLYLLAQQASPSDVLRAYIYQGSTLVGSTVFTGAQTQTCPPAFTGTPAGGCYFATTTVSISPSLAPNSQTNFTIKADIAPIGVGQPGTPGDYIVMGLADAQGVGATSGTTINSGSAPNQVGVRIFRSYPTVAPAGSGSSASAGGAYTTLGEFTVTANSSNGIGLDRVGLNVAVSSPSAAQGSVAVSSLQVYAFTDPGFSAPAPGTSGGLVGSLASPSLGTSAITLSTNSGLPLEIPAGTTYYFEVVATVTQTAGTAGGHGSVETSIAGDSAYSGIGAASSVAGNFVWSPNSNAASSLTVSDWTNGYGVSGLPSNGLELMALLVNSPTPAQPTPAPSPASCPTGYTLESGSCVVTTPTPAPTQPVSSSAPNITTAQYTGLSFNVGSQDSNTHDVAFSADGTKMYISGTVHNTIFEYALSTPWNVSSASYSGVSLYVGNNESDGGEITFSPDGTKMYLAGDVSNTVWEYSLSNPWDLSSATSTSLSFNLSAQISSASNPLFSPDGTKMYVSSWRSGTVYEYALTTPWNVSTASYTSKSFAAPGGTAITAFSSDGTAMYGTDFGPSTVYEYPLSTAWDVSTASQSGASLNVSAQDPGPHTAVFSSDGTKMYMLGFDKGQIVYEYSVSAGPLGLSASNASQLASALTALKGALQEFAQLFAH